APVSRVSRVRSGYINSSRGSLLQHALLSKKNNLQLERWVICFISTSEEKFTTQTDRSDAVQSLYRYVPVFTRHLLLNKAIRCIALIPNKLNKCVLQAS
uniref:Uncharacterized protein n=1 Tax=Anopheles quadriannulatus TaxID=34691 RepID=A0A182XTY4_ANOQN